MKCLILAGGTGDSLWPLSRKNYPKQFMNIRDGRSLLQETVVRNMPFCDEFIIVTNEGYSNILEGQMKVFQGLRYRIIYEAIPGGTMAAVTLGCMFSNQSDLLLVTVADLVLETSAYKETILNAKEIARTGHIGNIVDAKSKDSVGLFICMAGVFINAVRGKYSDVYKICRDARRELRTIRRNIKVPERIMSRLPQMGIQENLFKTLDNIDSVNMGEPWCDVDTVLDIEHFSNDMQNNVIQYECDNVSVVNNAKKHLIVTNGINDLAIINTEDATYITDKESLGNIKTIISDSNEKYNRFFADSKISYRPWGTHEILTSSEHFKVKKVIIYPRRSMRMHRHEHRSEHWTIVDGIADITINNVCKQYMQKDNIYIPVGAFHKVANNTDEPVVIIETGIGDILSENDTINDVVDAKQSEKSIPDIIKLSPAFKDNLWGGTKLRTVFGKKCDYDVIGESWELSAHPDGQSVIADGEYSGMFFGEFINTVGKGAEGWKCESLDRFPILIKFIDAKAPLSIQIHPDDDYALENENEYGKNEMWYIVSCEPGAYIYCGLSIDASKEEIRRRIEDNTITDILNKIEVKPGDCVFVKAGTIHAIGAGILICEIQQNSNCTYRMYDFDRRDKFGNKRELHVDKAIDVVDEKKYVCYDNSNNNTDTNENGKELVSCKYFMCNKYTVSDKKTIIVDPSSFVSIIVISGAGTIGIAGTEETKKDFKMGDSFFVSAGNKIIEICGNCEIITTRV